MVKVSKKVFIDYNVNITDSLTISGLSVRIFLRDFYKNNIPSISKANIYRYNRKAYYGGNTDVYKPEGYNLFYYDVNSLYPYVTLNAMPGMIYKSLHYYKENTSLDYL